MRRVRSLVLRADGIEKLGLPWRSGAVNPGLFLNKVPVLIGELRAAVGVNRTPLPRLAINDGGDGPRHNHGSRIVDEPLSRVRRESVPEFFDVHNNQHCPSLVGGGFVECAGAPE